MLRRCLLFVVLVLALTVPVDAACCAGMGGCPATAASSADCCAAIMEDPAAKRCCDTAATPEQLLASASANSHCARLAAEPPVVMGLDIDAAARAGRDGQRPPSPHPHEPLYTLHSVLLI